VGRRGICRESVLSLGRRGRGVLRRAVLVSSVGRRGICLESVRLEVLGVGVVVVEVIVLVSSVVRKVTFLESVRKVEVVVVAEVDVLASSAEKRVIYHESARKVEVAVVVAVPVTTVVRKATCLESVPIRRKRVQDLRGAVAVVMSLPARAK